MHQDRIWIDMADIDSRGRAMVWHNFDGHWHYIGRYIPSPDTINAHEEMWLEKCSLDCIEETE